MDRKRFMIIRLKSIYRWAQLVRQDDSPELNLLPGVLVMHLSQQTSVSFPTISVTIALSFSCYIKKCLQSTLERFQDCGTHKNRQVLNPLVFNLKHQLWNQSVGLLSIAINYEKQKQKRITQSFMHSEMYLKVQRKGYLKITTNWQSNGVNSS